MKCTVLLLDSFLLLIFLQFTLANENVQSRGLVKDDVKYKDIVAEHRRYWEAGNHTKYFPGVSLGYVTPVSFIAGG